ncbi:UDP-N-acetylmuramoyl-L-alanine--D-glutamate ligase [Aestuariispira insulae]|uniref:UDP-N-acetylmuramoylalanine--D-glutamate ligase n=1 Tax=Aestuariispira insulae TaxID=1461337 RepID=A0A3D9HX77_9PROT|nr:UDP-N-acetylmuramoyl-L-alanine--D-glutamate ligase [Aestuariispira insulae]RED54112.1 UDP-N-acetylmuramoylalanine--D-glutamate ligase [Aestuariispira insulae]
MQAARTYKDKKIAVMGLGRAGLGAVHALLKDGAEVLAWDDNEHSRDRAQTLGATVTPLAQAGAFDDVEALVLSPGIPHTHPAPHPVAAAAKAAGVPIIGEVALLAGYAPKANYIGITGTNGKSTTTALIGHILHRAGKNAEVGGNLGVPATDLKRLDADGAYVIEMSSYQLELSPIHFKIAVLLNITPDHLPRHGGMDGYVAAKARIFDGQGPGDIAVISVDDDRCAGVAEALTLGQRRVVPISCHHTVAGGVYVDGEKLIDDLDGDTKHVLDLSTVTTMPGSHNWQNMAAAYAVARLYGVSARQATDAILDFPGLPHRQQMIAILDRVAYVNDSKATNAEAAAKALSCYPAIYWIAGGQEKDGGYDILTPHLKNVRHAFLIGEGAKNMGASLSPHITVSQCGTLDTALNAAHEMARENGERGAVVLLSPACASFDQFASFEDRGAFFCDLVRKLPCQNRQMLVEGIGS